MTTLSDTLDLRSHTTALPLTGQPILVLDRADTLTLVEAGHLDLFAVPVRDGRPAGRWTFLARIGAGGLIPGGVPGPLHQLIARPSLDARLSTIAAADLARMVGPEIAHVVSGIDRVISELAHSLRGGLPPREFVPVSRPTAQPPQQAQQAQPPLTVGAGEAIRSIDGVLWVDIESGCAEIGDAAGDTVEGRQRVCLTERDWLTATEPTTLTVQSTRDLAVGGELWHAVVTHMLRTLQFIDIRVCRRDSEERAAMRRRAELDAQAMPSTATRFESLLRETESAISTTKVSGSDSALDAAKQVAAELGFQVRPPVAGSVLGRHHDEVSAIALASGVRTRTIRLGTGWWRSDVGPFVAFRKQTGEPVAAIRVGGRYVLRQAGDSTPVTAKVAGELDNRGTVLYPSLPPEVRGVKGLLRFGLSGNKSDYWRFGLMATLVAGIGLLTPLMTGQVLGTFVARADRSLIVQGSLLVIAAALVVAVLSVVQNFAVLRIESRASEKMQAGVWNRLLSLPAAFFARYSTGSLGTAVMGVNAAQELLSGMVITATLGLITGLANLVLVFFIDVKLALVGAGLLLVAVAAAWVATRLDIRRQQAAYQAGRQVASRVFQLLTAVPKLRVAAAEDRAFGVWADEFAAERSLTTASRRIENRMAVFNAGFPIVCSIVLFAVVGGSVPGSVSVTTFLAFLAAFTILMSATVQFTTAAITAIAVVPMFQQLTPILSTEPEIDAGKADPGELSGRVTLSEVSFRYGDGPAVLDRVSFSVDAGEFVAVVGPSGSGKSTLLRLLLGFERPGSGAVLYDGQDLADLDVGAVRRQCGVVLQHGGLFAGDIKSNIIGSTTYSVEDAWAAAEMSGIAADIKAMPMGMNTVLSEGTSALSGGQRQRLMIARALIGRPRIVYFDEATSALDNPTQLTVAEATHRLNASRIVVAHRLTTIMGADRIIVLDKGKIVQQGSYAELMADADGLFAQLARRQTS